MVKEDKESVSSAAKSSNHIILNYLGIMNKMVSLAFHFNYLFMKQKKEQEQDSLTKTVEDFYNSVKNSINKEMLSKLTPIEMYQLIYFIDLKAEGITTFIHFESNLFTVNLDQLRDLFICEFVSRIESTKQLKESKCISKFHLILMQKIYLFLTFKESTMDSQFTIWEKMRE